jgi:hypothetical protein
MASEQMPEGGIGFARADLAGYDAAVSTLAEIEQAARILPVEQKQRLIAALLAELPKKRGDSSGADATSDEAVHASLLPLAAKSWSQDWDSPEEDEAWRDL